MTFLQSTALQNTSHRPNVFALSQTSSFFSSAVGYDVPILKIQLIQITAINGNKNKMFSAMQIIFLERSCQGIKTAKF